MKKRTVYLWMGIVFFILLLPFFLGALGAHPATDDFTFATYTRPTFIKTGSLLHVLKDAFSYTMRTWRDWQGTVTGVFLMTLNPAVFSIKAYGWHVVILLVLHLLAWAVFMHHFLAKRIGLPGEMWLLYYFVLSACSLIFLPDIVEGIYWYNGAWFYTGAQAVGLLTLVLCDHVTESRRNDRLSLGTGLCFILLFALGMDNYITAMMCFMGVLVLALLRLLYQEGQERLYSVRKAFLLMIPITAGLILSVIAPGNKVRMAVDGAHESSFAWLAGSVFDTILAGFFYTGRFLVKTPLLAFLLFMTPELMLVRSGRAFFHSHHRVVFAVSGYFLILWAMLFPHIYSSGYAGSGRVINMYHDYVLTALPIVHCICLPGGKTGAGQESSFFRRKLPWRICAALALLLCLILGQQKNYIKLVSDQFDGVQTAYREQFRKEYAILEAAEPDSDVILPTWQVQTVTGKPTAYPDPNVWTNVSMADYFGVRSVRTAE